MLRRAGAVYALSLLVLLAAASRLAAQDAPIAAYSFDTVSGGTVRDESGNGNTGTVTGATWTAAGRFGGAMAFDGIDDWMTVADRAPLDLTTGMTLEAWVHLTSNADWSTVVMKEITGGLSYGLYASDGHAAPAAWVRRPNDVDATGTAAIPLNTWVHLASTSDASSLSLYVNGTRVATRAASGSIRTSAQPLRVGGNSSWGEFFAGRIDEVRIYRRALTQSEIRHDMETPISGAPADFSIAAAPASRSVAAGSSTTFTVSAAGVNGFSGTVALSVDGLPANASASVSPASIAAGASATLTVVTTGATPVGTTALTVTGTSGAASRTALVDLAVAAPPPAPDFTIAIAPSTRSASAGASTSYTISVGALNGFTGAVALSASGLPPSASASFSPASISGSGTSVLTVSTASSTPAGTAALSIAGASAALRRTGTADLVVLPATGKAIGIHFNGSGSAMAAAERAGAIPQANWNNASGAARTAPLALVDEAGGATSASVTWMASGVWRLPISDQPGDRRLMRGYLDTSDTSVTTVTVTGLPAFSYDVYVYTDGDNGTQSRAAAYRLVPAGGTGTTISVTDAANANFSGTFTQASGAAGNYARFSLTGSGFTLTATPGASAGNHRAPLNAIQIVPAAGAPVPDFTLLVNPETRTIAQGGSTTYDVTVAAVNGFSGVVPLAVSGLPPGASAVFSPPSISGAGTATLTVTTPAATPPGTSALTLTGTSGAETRTANASLAVNAAAAPDFSIAAAPGSQNIQAGSSASYAVTVGAINGFTGGVTLSASGLPASTSASFTPAALSGGGKATLTIATTAATPAGTAAVTIAGTSGSTVRTASVSLAVAPAGYTVSGIVTPAAAGAGTTVSLNGAAAASTSADAAGAFQFTGLAAGTYLVNPSRSGYAFSPVSRNVTVTTASVAGVDFAATQSSNSIAISAPAAGAAVNASFSISATASASIVAVLFQVDGVNVGAEDTAAPYAVTVTAPAGSHRLTAVGRDAAGNTVTSAGVTIAVNGSSGTALALDAAQTFQTMDGFGVNVNSLSWKQGEAIPALDRLLDELGAKTWRVVFDMMDWEAANDDADPKTANWTYFNGIYSSAKFENLWATLRYLNQRGVTSGIVLSFMGRVPSWMGGPRVTSSTTMEDEWVETVATLLYYARNTASVQFDLVSPLNEPDWDGFEGPQVDQWQYPRLLQKLAARLDTMGLADMRFVGPDTASVDTGVNTYLPQLLANSMVMNRLDRIGVHNYAGLTAGLEAKLKSSAYPQKRFWITELSIPEQIFTMIGQGASSALIWDGYDSVYNHAIIAGAFYNDGRGSTPPNDAGNLPALLSYNAAAGTYAARPQFYQMQAFKYVLPGMVRIGAAESHPGLTLYAFRHPVNGRITIVGRNAGGSSITLNGSMSGAGAPGALQFYQSGLSNNYSSFTRGADAVVTSGTFVTTVPAYSFFTLTSVP